MGKIHKQRICHPGLRAGIQTIKRQKEKATFRNVALALLGHYFFARGSTNHGEPFSSGEVSGRFLAWLPGANIVAAENLTPAAEGQIWVYETIVFTISVLLGWLKRTMVGGGGGRARFRLQIGRRRIPSTLPSVAAAALVVLRPRIVRGARPNVRPPPMYRLAQNKIYVKHL